MFTRFGKKQTVSVELNDYIFRLFSKDTGSPEGYFVFEATVEEGMIQNGELADELALFELLKFNLDRWNMKRKCVRFFVPEPSVLMRPIEVPTDVRPESLTGLIQMELGNTIHLPFENPVLDIHDPDPEDGKATLFAAPAQEVSRLAALYDDATLEPTVADVRMLANGRFLKQSGLLKQGRTVLVADWLHNGVSFGIFGGYELEFHRYQDIQAKPSEWKFEERADNLVTFSFGGDEMDYRNQLLDLVLETGRIINFYQFSLYKGERAVDEIVVMGDNHDMNYIKQQLDEAQEQPVTVIDDVFVKRYYPGLFGRHAVLIGLSLRGEV